MLDFKETPTKLFRGNCLEVMKTMEDNSVDSIVTDPPYELGFMGKAWDSTGIANNVEMWKEAFRVLKPGGHLLSFSGSRTYHRMTCAIEDAGFEIRDQIMWMYGSGFPKSRNISKDIDKLAGAEREVIGKREHPTLKDKSKVERTENSPNHGNNTIMDEWDITVPATDAAKQWDGWGTALKPAHEPICVARKPLSEKTVASNVLKHGTGGINIDGCRVSIDTIVDASQLRTMNRGIRETDDNGQVWGMSKDGGDVPQVINPSGRWPANFIHDGSDDVLELFPVTKSGAMKASTKREAQDVPGSVCYGTYGGNVTSSDIMASEGSAARYFYCAKTSKTDRHEGLLNKNKELVTWENVDLSVEIVELNSLLRGMSEDIFLSLKNCEWSMLYIGSKPLEKYQKDIKSITETVSNMIIESKTSNVSPRSITKESTLSVIQMMQENGLNLVENVGHIKTLQRNTINELTALALGVVLAAFKVLLKIKEKGNLGNNHSTVKPTDLMRYLCRLVTPSKGIVFDPFMGSGSTGKAALLENFNFVGIEMDETYFNIAKTRIDHVTKNDEPIKPKKVLQSTVVEADTTVGLEEFYA
jgi:DNA modification methylase